MRILVVDSSTEKAPVMRGGAAEDTGSHSRGSQLLLLHLNQFY